MRGSVFVRAWRSMEARASRKEQARMSAGEPGLHLAKREEEDASTFVLRS
jgi:hypothetical protein